MSFKTTYWLFGILAVILCIFGLAIYFDPLPPDLESYLFPSAQDPKAPLTSDKVVEVTIERVRPTAETITYVRDPQFNRWKIKTAGGEIAGDTQQIKQMIDDTLKLQRGSKVQLGSPDKYGLSAPETTVSLKLADGKALSLKIGDTTAGEKNTLTYVQSSDRAQVLAVKHSDLEKLLRPEVNYRDRDPLVAQTSTIQGVKVAHTVEGKEKEPTVQIDKVKDSWVYQAPFKGDANNTSTDLKVDPGQPPRNVPALLDQILKLRIEFTDDKANDFVAAGVTDWAKYGLQSGADLLTIDLTRTEQANPNLPTEGEGKPDASTLIGKPSLIVAIGKKADDKNDRYYARRAGENVVFKVAAAPIAALLELLKQPDAVRDRHLLTLDSERRVPNVMILKNDAGTLEFYRRDKMLSWQLYRGSDTKPQNLDENLVKGLLSLLGQDRMIETFPDASAGKIAEYGFDNPTLVASFWIDGIVEEKKDEKKDGEEKKPDLNAKPALKNSERPTAKLTFGKRNRERKTVYVKREAPDEPTGIFEVREVLFERLSDGPLAYLDKKLPSFREGTLDAVSTVTKLTFTLKGKTTEVSRAKDGDPWKVVLPKELEGRLVDANAVSEVLSNLNRLSAGRYLVEKATQVQLTNDYGLNPPAEKAEVTLTRDGKTETYGYLFGKDAGEPGNLFAKLDGAFNTDMVFTVDRSTLNLFDRAILDPTVFNFAPAKVNEITLRGWQATAGFVLTLELVRKDDKTWEVKAGPPKDEFTLDSAKVNKLLLDLSHLRADRFVAHGKNPDPAQKLDVKVGGLFIRLRLEGEEKPLELLLGEADGQSYFATSSTLPGDILQVSKSLFEGPRGSVGYFKK